MDDREQKWLSHLNAVLAFHGMRIYASDVDLTDHVQDEGDRFGMTRALALPCTYTFYNQLANRPLLGMEFSVICCDPLICGAARVECEPTEGRFYIGHVFVSPDKRHRGIGRQLVLSCVALHGALRDRYPDVSWSEIEMDAASRGGEALLRFLSAQADSAHDFTR